MPAKATAKAKGDSPYPHGAIINSPWNKLQDYCMIEVIIEWGEFGMGSRLATCLPLSLKPLVVVIDKIQGRIVR